MDPTSLKFILLTVGAALLLILAVFLWRPLHSTAVSNLATVRQSRAELSQYTWPEWPIQDALRREIDMSEVIAGYERALAINPNNVSANRRLGQIELSLGEYESALGHLESAYAGATWDNTARQLYGEALIANDRLEEGALLWQQVNNEQGQLAARAFWYKHIGDDERLAAIRAAKDN